MLKKSLHKNLKKLFMVVAMVCILTAPAFAAGTNPLNFIDANVCTINGQTATPGVSIVSNPSVASGLQHIEIRCDKNVSSDLTGDGTRPVLSTNQASIHLTDTTTSTSVPISVYRLGDGTAGSLEKQNLFFDVNLVSTHNYKITIDSGLIAYNGVTLGTTKLVNFTAQ